MKRVKKNVLKLVVKKEYKPYKKVFDNFQVCNDYVQSIYVKFGFKNKKR